MSDFRKIRLVVTELFRAEGRTDVHDEINRRFSQFF